MKYLISLFTASICALLLAIYVSYSMGWNRGYEKCSTDTKLVIRQFRNDLEKP